MFNFSFFWRHVKTKNRDLTVFLGLHSQCNAYSEAVLDDSLITVHTTSLKHHIALNSCEVSDEILVLIWKFAWEMPANDTKKKLVSHYKYHYQ